jgi:hypothetical protein
VIRLLYIQSRVSSQVFATPGSLPHVSNAVFTILKALLTHQAAIAYRMLLQGRGDKYLVPNLDEVATNSEILKQSVLLLLVLSSSLIERQKRPTELL